MAGSEDRPSSDAAPTLETLASHPAAPVAVPSQPPTEEGGTGVLPRPVRAALQHHGLNGDALSVYVRAVDAEEPLLSVTVIPET